MKNICLFITAALLIGIAACEGKTDAPEPGARHRDPAKEAAPPDANQGNLTYIATKLNDTEVVHQLTLKVDSNTCYRLLALTERNDPKASRALNFNEMEK